MSATILFIGGRSAKDNKFVAALEKEYHVVVTRSGKRGIQAVNGERLSAIILDAVSLRTHGERLCRTMKTQYPAPPLIHIHPGPRNEAQSPADLILFYPLSTKRLLNSLGSLLNAADEEILGCGPFVMNVTRRTLIAHGKETQLTPKQAQLAEIFLRNPGQTMDRPTLMKKVWDTNYLGDTRTLDVHIRWIRQAMENSDKPRYLETVRGVGYRLVVPPEERASSEKRGK